MENINEIILKELDSFEKELVENVETVEKENYIKFLENERKTMNLNQDLSKEKLYKELSGIDIFSEINNLKEKNKNKNIFQKLMDIF